MNWDSHIASSLISQISFFQKCMLLDLGFLTEETSWIHRNFKIWYQDKKKILNQINLKIKASTDYHQISCETSL